MAAQKHTLNSAHVPVCRQPHGGLAALLAVPLGTQLYLTTWVVLSTAEPGG